METGIHPSSISRFQKGERAPAPYQVEELADALGLAEAERQRLVQLADDIAFTQQRTRLTANDIIVGEGSQRTIVNTGQTRVGDATGETLLEDLSGAGAFLPDTIENQRSQATENAGLSMDEESRHQASADVYPYRNELVVVTNELTKDFVWTSRIQYVIRVEPRRLLSNVFHTNREASLWATRQLRGSRCQVAVSELPAGVMAHTDAELRPSDAHPSQALLRAHFAPPLTGDGTATCLYVQSYRAIGVRPSEVGKFARVPNSYYAGKQLAFRSSIVSEPTERLERTIWLPLTYDPAETGCSVSYRGNLDPTESRRAGLGFQAEVLEGR